VFKIAIAGRAGTIKERMRLSRPRFEQFWGTRAPCRVLMEACATSHYWARYLIARGFEVTLLPPHYVKPTAAAARQTVLTARPFSRLTGAPAFTRWRSRATISRPSSFYTASGLNGSPAEPPESLACTPCCGRSGSPYRWDRSAS
jgi:hypothetical protein